MSENKKRILFLCSQHSMRSLMAASLFATQTHERWDIWSTPVRDGAQEQELVYRVLDEIGMPLLVAPQTTEPAFNLSWDEGVVLCSGQTDL